jgi:hypothetical protein
MGQNVPFRLVSEDLQVTRQGKVHGCDRISDKARSWHRVFLFEKRARTES